MNMKVPEQGSSSDYYQCNACHALIPAQEAIKAGGCIDCGSKDIEPEQDTPISNTLQCVNCGELCGKEQAEDRNFNRDHCANCNGELKPFAHPTNTEQLDERLNWILDGPHRDRQVSQLKQLVATHTAEAVEKILEQRRIYIGETLDSNWDRLPVAIEAVPVSAIQEVVAQLKNQQGGK